ncbi:MAG: hypothetical protein M0Q95_03940 [Porticoccaceae bacterium]|nr:hypothetical protein [Porticoccaceae bacterium]
MLEKSQKSVGKLDADPKSRLVQPSRQTLTGAMDPVIRQFSIKSPRFFQNKKQLFFNVMIIKVLYLLTGGCFSPILAA